MTDDLEPDDLEAEARERADAVREKRHQRADPEDRVGRVRAQGDPPADLDLPAPSEGEVDLPDPVRAEFDEVRKKVAYGVEEEFGVEMETEAHYWPLVVHLGVERLKGMWLDEVRDALEDTDGIEPPEED